MVKKFWLFCLLIIVGVSWALYSQKTPVKKQDMIKFSHKYHQEEVGAACADCHTMVSVSVTADDNLLPGKDQCQSCHDVESEETCTTCHFDNEDTRMALPLVKSEIIFNHKFHIAEQKLECVVCHKNIAQVDFADEHSKAEMADCSTCHNNEQATLECVSCHTNTLNLRPIDHSADYLVSHKNIARIDQEACTVCHTQNDCAECHEGGSLLTTTPGTAVDVQSSLLPSVAGGTKGLVVSRVHDLNFRVTHGLAAQGRSQECAVCHETQNFCQTCHDAEGVDVAGKPVWHGGPDWGALAGVVGTGGGRHADLAKRDIENCAACHSTAGDDPTCLLCHIDFDGVKGTNPKTHESGYANQFDEGDSFHDDDAALCFTCHTNTQQAGLGFCGYCHGPK